MALAYNLAQPEVSDSVAGGSHSHNSMDKAADLRAGNHSYNHNLGCNGTHDRVLLNSWHRSSDASSPSRYSPLSFLSSRSPFGIQDRYIFLNNNQRMNTVHP